jgi:hypothetical protein
MLRRKVRDSLGRARPHAVDGGVFRIIAPFRGWLRRTGACPTQIDDDDAEDQHSAGSVWNGQCNTNIAIPT